MDHGPFSAVELLQRAYDIRQVPGLLLQPSLKSMFSFGLLIVVLLLRPQGLLGRKEAR